LLLERRQVGRAGAAAARRRGDRGQQKNASHPGLDERRRF
jgi:hypothetical protein